MHGVVHSLLQQFIVETYTKEVWDKVYISAKLQTKEYLPSNIYGDEEFSKVVIETSKILNKSGEILQEEFGEFMLPHLMKMYSSFVKPTWKALDFLENVEEVIHRTVRLKNYGAHPPTLFVKRINSKEIELEYNSPRKMTHLLLGMIRGTGKYYNENLVITPLPQEGSIYKVLIKVH